MRDLLNFISARLNNFASGVIATAIILTASLGFSRVSLDYVGEFQMSFSELSAILLTASAVIITVFGLGLAIMGLVGWDNLQRVAVNKAVVEATKAAEEKSQEVATDVAVSQVKQEMKQGGKLWIAMESYVDDLIYSETRGSDEDYPDEEDEHGGA